MKHPKFQTTPQVSRRMASVHLKGGKAETMLAKALWHKGYRYRRNDRRLPGSPDIALARYRIAVFVDGEFWHGYRWAERRERLKANRAYWLEKIQENIDRDRRNDLLLSDRGWTVLHLWEGEVKRDLEGCVRTVEELVLERIAARAEERSGPPCFSGDQIV